MKKVSYLVLFYLKRSQKLTVGSLGSIFFERGYYLYVGSYPYQSVEKRIQRHRLKKKKLFWHIDYFSSLATVRFLDYYLFSQPECRLARFLRQYYKYIDSFGSSDCHCSSHMFFVAEKPNVEKQLGFLQKKVDHRSG